MEFLINVGSSFIFGCSVGALVIGVFAGGLFVYRKILLKFPEYFFDPDLIDDDDDEQDQDYGE